MGTFSFLLMLLSNFSNFALCMLGLIACISSIFLPFRLYMHFNHVQTYTCINKYISILDFNNRLRRQNNSITRTNWMKLNLKNNVVFPIHGVVHPVIFYVSQVMKVCHLQLQSLHVVPMCPLCNLVSLTIQTHTIVVNWGLSVSDPVYAGFTD